MDLAGSKTVTDAEGVCGRVVPASPEVRSTAAHMVVQLDKCPQVLVPTHLLIPQPDGSYALPCRLAALEPAGSEHRVHQDEPLVIPVVVEELEVQKRVVETGKVRLTKVVHERETLVDEPLWREHVTITRVPIGRVVEGPVPVREEEDTTILSVVEEVLVVEKRWMLQEEIHIRQERLETHQPQRITLRSEEVQIARVPHADDAS
jgi:uncharacterized protein (TIGR02271 family)